MVVFDTSGPISHSVGRELQLELARGFREISCSRPNGPGSRESLWGRLGIALCALRWLGLPGLPPPVTTGKGATARRDGEGILAAMLSLPSKECMLPLLPRAIASHSGLSCITDGLAGR